MTRAPSPWKIVASPPNRQITEAGPRAFLALRRERLKVSNSFLRSCHLDPSWLGNSSPSFVRQLGTRYPAAIGEGADGQAARPRPGVFREESTKLVPPPKRKDAYEDEAYRLWALNVEANGPSKTDLTFAPRH